MALLFVSVIFLRTFAIAKVMKQEQLCKQT